MGSCLREVEALAFLKIKREEARLIRAPFAELASWFYRRSSIGGVDHVCLVFRGGGVSLREAMTERSQTQAAAGVKQPSLLTWEVKDIVAVARGLLEVGWILHIILGFVFRRIARVEVLPLGRVLISFVLCALSVTYAGHRLLPFCWPYPRRRQTRERGAISDHPDFLPIVQQFRERRRRSQRCCPSTVRPPSN